ncbi:LysR family transcriptional regulator [Hydrogenophaga sp.]|uniref:LysR family transcriptional regulator n=1 Tax=Hydrogenophaga sp. TaxID=1904254 RepID=UPI0026180080|nr:LysR family transcriptional regulator [Hydrogenophaga sp.]MDM7950837.1 LysR family transcriptional regulator [Hydrogenophaga sp.]
MARRLQAQQLTLSRHIAELELQLGVPLFKRTGRAVTPTFTGLAIAEAARQVEGGASELTRILAKSRGATTNTASQRPGWACSIRFGG